MCIYFCFRLQDEYLILQQELKSTIEESKLVQEKYKGLLDQVKREIATTRSENQELKTQVRKLMLFE